MVGDLRKPETMKAVVEAAVAHMSGLDVLVISGGNGGWEYLVSTTCILLKSHMRVNSKRESLAIPTTSICAYNVN